MRVVPTSGLSENEIKRMIEEADSHKEDDQVKKELAELRNNAETLVYTTEGALREYGQMLNPTDRADIAADLEHCKRILENGSVDQLREAVQQLQDSSYRIAAMMYDGAAQKKDEEPPPQ